MFESAVEAYFRDRVPLFPQPWYDYSSAYLPSTHWDALRLCEYIVSTQPAYQSAIERIVSYFITEVEISGSDRSGNRKYKELLENVLGIYNILRAFGVDYLTYGNCFVSIIPPIVKFGLCNTQGCGSQFPLLKILEDSSYEAIWNKGKLTAKCPKCKRTGEWKIIERRSFSPEELKIKRWSPHEIEIEYSPYTERTRYIWRIPGYFRDLVLRGSPFVISTSPELILKACLNNENIRFYDSAIFHAKEPSLSGLYVRGWGVSRILSHFRQAWLLGIYYRHNEAVAMDYIMPLRIIFPETKGTPLADPALMGDLGIMRNQLEQAIHSRRIDPTRWVFAPFPIRYQFIGAEASNLVPVQLIEYTKADLLDTIGIPIELYKANLSITGGPIALRLFESAWSHLTFAFNRFLQWVVDKISTLFGWDSVTAKLSKPSLHDDINRQMARLQLMASGLISKTTGLKALGLDLQTELQQSLEDEKLIARKTQKTQEELQKIQSMEELFKSPPQAAANPAVDLQTLLGGGGGEVPPEAAQGQGPSSPDAISLMLANLDLKKSTPSDIERTAETIASSIYAMPLEQRISALRSLQKKNSVIHAIVKEKLRQLDQQAEAQGRTMGRQMASMQSASPGMPGI